MRRLALIRDQKIKAKKQLNSVVKDKIGSPVILAGALGTYQYAGTDYLISICQEVA
ncbi:hypothetical protein VISI1226_13501 [Vibrio sinaloensis DSM 21326]|uniref:Uncharacterized protein n=1 Tax=Vibrio sinaloensis DSM 21326 TaxID=945550 RepID=E8M6U6_PHOS4|nr:hypothetical protein [Vibrio sinaloensis]EGA70250.1 hypothetical protein VISI1226_13501 [Vibrio sinaloensis DSM 21326]